VAPSVTAASRLQQPQPNFTRAGNAFREGVRHEGGNICETLGDL